MWSAEADSGAAKPSLVDLIRKAEAGPVAKSAKSAVRAASDGWNELLGVNFLVGPQGCLYFNSEMNYTGVRKVVVTLLASGTSLATTRIIPLFSVPGMPFPTSVVQVKGADFAYSDGGGATVPVSGRYLRLLVCNDSNAPITYSQLAIYNPGLTTVYQ